MTIDLEPFTAGLLAGLGCGFFLGIWIASSLRPAPTQVNVYNKDVGSGGGQSGCMIALVFTVIFLGIMLLGLQGN